MTGPDDVDLLRRALAPHARGEHPSTPDCLDDDTIAALAEASLDAESRAAAWPHLSACPRCRRQVASVACTLADPRVAREIRVVEGGRRRAVPWSGWVAAAAVLLLLAQPGQVEEPGRHRSPPITAEAAPEPVSPVGLVRDAPSLLWNPVAGADRYRVALFDAEGRVLYQAEVTGTVVSLPDSAMPTLGDTYWWQVEARTGFGRWVASGLIEFSLTRGPQP